MGEHLLLQFHFLRSRLDDQIHPPYRAIECDRSIQSIHRLAHLSEVHQPVLRQYTQQLMRGFETLGGALLGAAQNGRTRASQSKRGGDPRTHHARADDSRCLEAGFVHAGIVTEKMQDSHVLMRG